MIIMRNGSGSIVQYIYGDDGMDATFIESQPLIVTKSSIDELAEMFILINQQNGKNII